jgi:hypothetical protein
MNGPLPMPFDAPDVQRTLEKIVDLVGQGFVTIGDGYMVDEYGIGTDGYAAKDLYDAFQSAFAKRRIATTGGIIVVKSGDYILKTTVVVPAGYTIFAEPNGARITSEVVGGPAFKFSASTDTIDIGDSTNPEVQTKQSRMWNLTIFDNRYGNVAFGGPSAPSKPLVEIDQAANVFIDMCMFVGRYLASGGSVTTSAIAVSGVAGPFYPTILHVHKSIFDVVSTAVAFNPIITSTCELRVEQCRARTFTTAITDSFVRTIIGKIFVHNNYHISFTPTGSTAGSFINIMNPLISDAADGFVSVIGNQGGLRIPDLASTNNIAKSHFILDSRPTPWAYKLLDIGNGWGSVNGNSWYITVGDGIHSTGDFTGVDALDRVNALCNTELTALFSRTEQVVIVNPGSYTTTTALNIGKLIGNVSPNETLGTSKKVIVSLGSNSQIASSGVYDNMIGKAENIDFFASGNFQRIRSDLNGVQDRNLFKNCNFTDVSILIDNYEGSVVSNCHFTQTGTYEDQIGLVVSSDNLSIVEGCVFDGYGYALSQSSWDGMTVLRDCAFTQHFNYDGYQNVIRNIDPIYDQSVYISIGNLTSKTIIDNVTVNSGSYPISSAMLDMVPKYIVVKGNESVAIRNSRFMGPDQVTSTGPIVNCFVAPGISATITDNEFMGALPLHISEFNLVNGFTLGGDLNVSNNQIKHYLGTMTAVASGMVIDISLAGGLFYSNCDGYDGYDGYGGDGYDGYGTDGYIPVTDPFDGQFPFSSVDVTNNRIIGLYRGGLAPVQYVTSSYTNLALCQIYAPGWSVNFNENEVVYACDDSPLPPGIYSQSAVFINNARAMPIFSKAGVKNNGIYHKCDGYQGQFLSGLYVITDVLQAQGNNFLSWYCTNQDVEDGYLFRAYIRTETHRAGSLIQNNSFNANVENSMSYPIYIDTTSDGYGAISENYFDSTMSGSIKTGDGFGHWLLTDRNYAPTTSGYLVRVDF